MKKAVLFDLDGTLWHTCDVILPVWNDILKKHKETTKQITLEEMNSYMGKTVEQIASIMLPELPLENSVAIVKECCAEQIPSLRKTGGHLYDNLESTLEILSKLADSNPLVALDARKNSAYLYCDGEIKGAVNIEEVQEIIKSGNYTVITDDKLKPLLGGTSYQEISHPLGEFLAELACSDGRETNWRKLKPLYIQPPPGI